MALAKRDPICVNAYLNMFTKVLLQGLSRSRQLSLLSFIIVFHYCISDCLCELDIHWQENLPKNTAHVSVVLRFEGTYSTEMRYYLFSPVPSWVGGQSAHPYQLQELSEHSDVTTTRGGQVLAFLSSLERKRSSTSFEHIGICETVKMCVSFSMSWRETPFAPD